MKLISLADDGMTAAGIVHNDNLYRLSDLHPSLPSEMIELISDMDRFAPVIRKALEKIDKEESHCSVINQAKLIAPLPAPPSFRDGYAFRAHVAAARRNRKVPMIEEFDQYPVFYFGNTSNFYGPGEVWFMSDHFERLDYELEVAIVIGRAGKNIRAEEAHNYIAGMMILNDWSARQLQMEEMLLNLGPAKGKDLGCSTGPWLVTLDELQSYEIEPPAGHRGKAWRLAMRGYINGQLMSEGNLLEMDWTFGELIERASYGVVLKPGDIIGSGTVGTGCLLELNGTHQTNTWLQENDIVRFDVERLGSLENTIRREPTDHSLLALKIKPLR